MESHENITPEKSDDNSRLDCGNSSLNSEQDISDIIEQQKRSQPQQEILNDIAKLSQIDDGFDEEKTFKQLGFKGIKSSYKSAVNSERINKAKLFLKGNDYSLDKLLALPDFQDYDKTADFKTYIRKFINNHCGKGGIQSQKKHQKQADDAKPSSPDQLGDKRTEVIQKTQLRTSIGPNRSLAPGIFNNGALFDYMVLQDYMKSFIQSQDSQRIQLLRELCARNSQTLLQFLSQLESTNHQGIARGIFSLLNILIENFEATDIDLQSRVFVSSLAFYEGEQTNVSKALLQEAVALLVSQSNAKQVAGLANFIIFNENQDFIKMAPLISKLDEANPGIVLLLKDTWDFFQVDHQVQKLIPNSLFILNKPYLTLLKRDHGLALIRDIPSSLTECFSRICAFCEASDEFDLIDYIYQTRSVFRQKQEQLHLPNIQIFMQKLGRSLSSREPAWIGQTEKILWFQRGIMTLQIEKGTILSDDQIDNALKGDFSELNSLLQLPRAIKDISDSARKELIHQLRTANCGSKMVLDYLNENEDQLFESNPCTLQIQQNLQFKLQAAQILCLNMALNFSEKNLFVNFGIGNGKTLLAALLAMSIWIKQQKHVFIVSKNEHLVQRDSKKFEKLYQKLNINCSFNSCQVKEGVSYYTQCALKKQYESGGLQRLWSQSTVILDEFDWILFDGTPKSMATMLQLFEGAQRLIGLSGSSITIKENRILEQVFDPLSLIFPSMARLMGDKVLKRKDILVSSNKQDYISELKQLIASHISKAPVLIVASDSYKPIETGLSHSGIDIISLNRNKAQNIEAAIDNRYLLKNKDHAYGVYMMNEAQGRGTDFLTNSEIDESGGPLLIVADIFSERSEIQVKGRIGRMNSNGSWFGVLYSQGSLDSVEQFIVVRQNILHLNEDKKQAQLMDLLERSRLTESFQEHFPGIPAKDNSDQSFAEVPEVQVPHSDPQGDKPQESLASKNLESFALKELEKNVFHSLANSSVDKPLFQSSPVQVETAISHNERQEEIQMSRNGSGSQSSMVNLDRKISREELEDAEYASIEACSKSSFKKSLILTGGERASIKRVQKAANKQKRMLRKLKKRVRYESQERKSRAIKVKHELFEQGSQDHDQK